MVDVSNKKHLSYNVQQNYPNPFKKRTNIPISISKRGKYQFEVFNISGQQLLSSIIEYNSAGNYVIKFDNTNLENGIYFYSISNEKSKLTKKMIIY